MSQYAEQTTVSPGRSREEIERTLDRFGATAFAYGRQEGQATIGFHAQERAIRLTMRVPTWEEFLLTPAGRQRTETQARKAQDQEERRLWRSMALMVKARLDAVQSGIETFEDAWLPYTVMPGGQTLSDLVLPQVQEAYASGQLPDGIAGLLSAGD